MPIYEWKRTVEDKFEAQGLGFVKKYSVERETTFGPIGDDPQPPPGEGWQRVYNYVVGKVSGVGDSPARIVKGR